MKHKKYYGVIPPIVTPIDERENVDEAGFRALIERCIAGGLHGIFVAGTNGEAMALTQSERNRAISIALDQVAGRIPVLAGVMDTSTRRVIDNIKALEQMGGTCAVITPIFYDRHTSQDETIRHFEKISKSTNIDLLIYNIPPFTGLKLAAPTIETIAEFDRVCGYKDSSGDYASFMRLISKFRDTDFSCLQGVTGQAVSSMLMGADGYVPSLAPLFPELFVDAYEAAVSGDIEDARIYNELIRKACSLLGMTKNGTAAAKYAISLTGLIDKRVIAPQDYTMPEEESRIAALVAHVNEEYAALLSSRRKG